jgi:cyclopropane fatty-acyl-phospholipid synthase-like methyltransferase
MRLNLGAGSELVPGWVNHDIVPLPGIGVVHDLDTFPWPWDDATAEQVRAYDVFEHVEHPLEFMRECHRVLAPGGVLHLHTAYWLSPNAHTDPTHRRSCTEQTFDYWVPGTYLNERYGAAYAQGCHFAKIDVHIEGTDLSVTLKKT